MQDAAQPLFTLAGIGMLRSPAQALCRAEVTQVDLPAGGPEEVGRSVEYLRTLADDPLFREAVTVSSPALARRWTRILAGEDCALPELRRAVRALTAYRIRMATRCTPFGLMAGVAPVAFADAPGDAEVRLGGGHRRVARVERDWLGALVQGWVTRPGVLRGLRVVANNLCSVRGDRVVLPYLPAGSSDEAVREVSVRHTEAVRAALDIGQTPCRFEELEQRLAALLPSAPSGAIARLLGRLVEKEFLLTEVRPPAESPDATGHVLSVLAGTDPAELPELAELRAVEGDLARYAGKPAGAGLEEWEAATARMRRLQARDRLVHVDLALDAEVRLPSAVGAEAVRAATLLWQLSPRLPVSPELDHYHQEFTERYGAGRAVPLAEALDPVVGLGAPSEPKPSVERADPERDRLLLEAALEAALSGAEEVALDDGHPLVTALRERHGAARSRSVEFAVRLLARSADALREGDFRLVVVGGFPSQAVNTFGRFAHLLPADQQQRLAELARAERTLSHHTDVLHAQVTFRARNGRGDNVVQVPQWLPHRLPVGVFADPAASDTLRLADLALCADQERLFVVDGASGREVAPTVFHCLDVPRLAPDTVRLLTDLADVGARGSHSWDWGRAAALPYLPRVTYGRSILAPARWRPTRALLDRRASFADWTHAVRQWRRRWRVPGRIRLRFGDQTLELSLDHSLHLRLLHHELGRRPQTVLEELPDADGSGSGWLASPEGGHRNELIVPLLAAPAGSRPSARPPAPRRAAPAEHLPGGEWLYAALHCAADHHNELLARHLPALIAELPPEVDRWFFLRYADPDPHLRLRFHGTPQALTAELLPRLHRWATSLRARRLVRGLRLDTYDPELERYGGPDAIAAAERAFHADSLAAVEALAHAEHGALDLEPVLLAAVGTIHLARSFWTAHTGDETAWSDWLLGAVPRDEQHREFRSRRREALALVDPYAHWAALRGRPGGRELLTAWQSRDHAHTQYALVLRELGDRSWSDPTQVLLSLLHMRHNRLLGIDRAGEATAMAIARGAVEAHLERRRRTTCP
ncbi:lantibiotic dehydratase [Kitasatospora sp. NPDC092039]|uniref:lantibiotic dehydratase n=1 Tax=Kitasatospora sp. NPDC092039 TaxID=3364086 RepID=UPI003825C88D